MVSNQGARPRDHTRFAKRTVIAPIRERDYPIGAAATYDLQASKRAVRDAETVLKRR
jgi:hypothetical protein